MAGRLDDVYENPLTKRYSSKEMSNVWSANYKFSTWRKIWLALAESEHELGLNITQEQLEQMRNNLDNIDYEYAEKKEKELRHDVMAHVHAFGEVAPKAMPIIHLGATSCLIGDTTEQLQMIESMKLIKSKLVVLMSKLKEFCIEYKSMPALGFTHLQPAQLVTVGKRASLWLQDFMLDYHQLETQMTDFPARGIKGTTGTQASFLELFDGDTEKVKSLNEKFTKKLGFTRTIGVSGQTYSRKLDFFVTSVLSGIAQSAHKMATDIRLLAFMKEIEEPFGKNQIGSSAMPWKRNAMRSERICSLARFVSNLVPNTAQTHSVQWLERTLDDSANRRLVLPEAFLGTDAFLTIAINVVSGLHVWPNVVRSNILKELPFMASEIILMECVKAGGNRQELHEAIRVHSMASSKRVKDDGASNDLLERIKGDSRFSAVHDHIDNLVDPSNFIGRAPTQVEEFIKEEITPILDENKELLDKFEQAELKV